MVKCFFFFFSEMANNVKECCCSIYLKSFIAITEKQFNRFRFFHLLGGCVCVIVCMFVIFVSQKIYL